VTSAPPTQYARTPDGARLAFQVLGDGPMNLIPVGGPASHLDLEWEEPSVARTLLRYAGFCRLVRFDRRGTGLSDPAAGTPTLEQQVDDLAAVMTAAQVQRPALLGAVESGLCAMYAASHPDQVSALILVNVAAAGQGLLTDDVLRAMLDMVENHWGEGTMLPVFAPSRAGDTQFRQWWTRYERASTTAAMARKLIELNARTDLTGVLPAVRVPTLVIHQPGNPLVPAALAREVAALVPGARFAEVAGEDLFTWAEPDSPVHDEVEQFLTGRRRHEPERVLATVLFTDIVDSTGQASRLGDRRWRALLDAYDLAMRRELDAFRGRQVKATGDGTLATFDGPARAIRCAAAITTEVHGLGLTLRSGLHIGEIELRGDGDVAGIAVHIARRVEETARPGEVLVSRTMTDLVAGSGIGFEDRGEHELKGVPGRWQLFAAKP
jgi:class 3 adenylate cyclase